MGALRNTGLNVAGAAGMIIGKMADDNISNSVKTSSNSANLTDTSVPLGRKITIKDYLSLLFASSLAVALLSLLIILILWH